MQRHRRDLRRRARGRPDHRRRLPLSRSAVALDDAVGDQVEQLALLGVEAGAVEPALCRGDHLQGPRADLLQRAGRRRSGRRAPRRRPGRAPRRSTSRMPGSALGGQDQRQGDGAVEQVGAARLAGPLRRAGDVEDVVEELEGEADLGAELAAAPLARRVPPSRTGALEQRRGLQPAALEVALARRSRCRRRPGAGRARRGRARPRPRRAARSRGRRRRRRAAAKAREKSRSPVRDRAARGRRWRRRSAGRGAAARRRGRRRGRASPCGPARSPSPARTAASPPPGAGAEQDQHRPQPLAAGRQGRARRRRRAARRGRRPARAAAPRPRRAGPAASGSTRRGPPSPAAGRPSGGSPGEAAVDRDDPAGEDRVADLARGRRASIFSARPRGLGEAADRLGQVGVGLGVARRGCPSSGTMRSNQSE